MRFEDYFELKDRAAGIDCPALSQLLHLIQAKDVAIKHHKAYLLEMHKWERDCAAAVEQAIKEHERAMIQDV